MKMIPTGEYKICNAQYSDRYFCMSGNREFVGHDVPHIIRLNVLSEREYLVTLLDVRSQLFIGIDPKEGKVKGYRDPHLIQLYAHEDDVKYIIYERTDFNLCYLKDGGNWTPISTEQIDGEINGDTNVSDSRLWTFERVE